MSYWIYTPEMILHRYAQPLRTQVDQGMWLVSTWSKARNSGNSDFKEPQKKSDNRGMRGESPRGNRTWKSLDGTCKG